MLSTFLSYSVARKSRAETPFFLLPNAPHSVLIITCTTNKSQVSDRQTSHHCHRCVINIAWVSVNQRLNMLDRGRVYKMNIHNMILSINTKVIV